MSRHCDCNRCLRRQLRRLAKMQAIREAKLRALETEAVELEASVATLRAYLGAWRSPIELPRR